MNHTFDTSTPTVLKSETQTFFDMNTMIPLIYCWISYNNVPSSELIWATTREDGSKLLIRTGSLLYKCGVWQVTYVILLSTWLLTWLWASVSELYIYSRQVNENDNNHMSNVTYVFFTFLDLTFYKSNNYRSGIIKNYLPLACLSLNWYIYSVCPTFDVPRNT